MDFLQHTMPLAAVGAQSKLAAAPMHSPELPPSSCDAMHLSNTPTAWAAHSRRGSLSEGASPLRPSSLADVCDEESTLESPLPHRRVAALKLQGHGGSSRSSASSSTRSSVVRAHSQTYLARGFSSSGTASASVCSATSGLGSAWGSCTPRSRSRSVSPSASMRDEMEDDVTLRSHCHSSLSLDSLASSQGTDMDEDAMVSGMRQSRIRGESLTEQCDQESTVINAGASNSDCCSFAASHGSLAAPGTDESELARARSRKRRNSRLHAAHPTPLLQARAAHMDQLAAAQCVPSHAHAQAAQAQAAQAQAMALAFQNKRYHPVESVQAVAPVPQASVGSKQKLSIVVPADAAGVVSAPAPVPVAAPAPIPVAQVASILPAVPAQTTSSSSSSHRRLFTPSPMRASLLSVLSCVLTQLFNNPNDRLPDDPRLISLFHTERIPSISIGKYLQRIAHYSEASDEALVMSFVHISRIYHANQSGAQGSPLGRFQLNTLSIHRLLLLSIMCSAKFYDDHFYVNSYYAKIGGVTTREINMLEVEFLSLIQFDLHLSSRIYSRFLSELANPALHPYCSCAWRSLPPVDCLPDDRLPESPPVELDLAALEHWTPSSSASAGVRAVPSPVHTLSPITPIAHATTNAAAPTASSASVERIVNPAAQAAVQHAARRAQLHHHRTSSDHASGVPPQTQCRPSSRAEPQYASSAPVLHRGVSGSSSQSGRWCSHAGSACPCSTASTMSMTTGSVSPRSYASDASCSSAASSAACPCSCSDCGEETARAHLADCEVKE